MQVWQYLHLKPYDFRNMVKGQEQFDLNQLCLRKEVSSTAVVWFDLQTRLWDLGTERTVDEGALCRSAL